MDGMTNGKRIAVYTRGCDMSALSDATKDAWRRLYSFDAMQVWTWRGGEALIVKDWNANYGRGDYRAIVRTGGTKRGTVRVLYANSFASAMEQMGIAFYVAAPRAKRERTSTELARATLARAARRNGNMVRTIRARPARIASAA